jgi:hypothetical protein
MMSSPSLLSNLVVHAAVDPILRFAQNFNRSYRIHVGLRVIPHEPKCCTRRCTRACIWSHEQEAYGLQWVKQCSGGCLWTTHLTTYGRQAPLGPRL